MKRAVSFRFRCPGAKSVAVAGDFNRWDVSAHQMAYEAQLDAWTITLALGPGRYEYKFFVDGCDWWNDPNAPTVPNVWGSENSYVNVQ